MSDIIYVSKETLAQLKDELHRMRTVDRPAAARAIAEAREKGDLKENAEYDAAKESQGLLEARIKKTRSRCCQRTYPGSRKCWYQQGFHSYPCDAYKPKYKKAGHL